ncbi:hypothetical protein FRC11_002854, partial [Ceratobasidium sp. 423]
PSLSPNQHNLKSLICKINPFNHRKPIWSHVNASQLKWWITHHQQNRNPHTQLRSQTLH